MKQLIKTFDLKMFNKKKSNLDGQIEELDYALYQLQKIKTATSFKFDFQDLINRKDEIFDKYLKFDIISTDYSKTTADISEPFDNPIDKYVKEKFFTPVDIIDEAKRVLRKYDFLIKEMREKLFTIKSDEGVFRIVKAQNADLYIMQECLEYTESEEETDFISKLQDICTIMDKLGEYKITPRFLSSLVKKNLSGYTVIPDAFNKAVSYKVPIKRSAIRDF